MAGVVAAAIERHAVAVDVGAVQHDRIDRAEQRVRPIDGRRRPGDLLNVEADVLAKYVERLLGRVVPAASADDRLRALLGS